MRQQVPSAAHRQADTKNAARRARPGQSDMLLLVARPWTHNAREKNAARCHPGLKLPLPLLRGCPLCMSMLITHCFPHGAAWQWCCRQLAVAVSSPQPGAAGSLQQPPLTPAPSAAGEGQLRNTTAELGCQPQAPIVDSKPSQHCTSAMQRASPLWYYRDLSAAASRCC